MGVGGHAQRRYGRYAGHPGHGVRYAAEAHALDTLPDSDIVRALRALPADLRLAVYLADVEGYCYREIAEITGTPVGLVASRLHHGRDRLRDRLARAAVQRGLPAASGLSAGASAGGVLPAQAHRVVDALDVDLMPDGEHQQHP